MRIRHDALVAAAEVVTGLRRLAAEIGGDAVTTVGTVNVSPNIVNAIPGRVVLSIDVRDPKTETLDRARSRVDTLVREACQREGVRYELDHYWQVPYTPFHAEVVATVERAAKAAGARHRRIRSGAGHDAGILAANGVACGMLFVRSLADGVSHSPEEESSPEDVELGIAVLAGVLRTLAAV